MKRQRPEEEGKQEEQEEQEEHGFARARDKEEPGAYSGGEIREQDRVVPGTASAREGYLTEGGTGHGEPLAGVESPGEEPSEEEAEGG